MFQAAGSTVSVWLCTGRGHRRRSRFWRRLFHHVVPSYHYGGHEHVWRRTEQRNVHYRAEHTVLPDTSTGAGSATAKSEWYGHEWSTVCATATATTPAVVVYDGFMAATSGAGEWMCDGVAMCTESHGACRFTKSESLVSANDCRRWYECSYLVCLRQRDGHVR